MRVYLIPIKPQVHTRKCHLDYNGTALLPLASWVRGTTVLEPPSLGDADTSGSDSDSESLSSTSQSRSSTPTTSTPSSSAGAPTVVYEILLYYEHNRACTIYRTWEDFEHLRRTITPFRSRTRVAGPGDIQGLHHYFKEALAKRPKDTAVEFFLRRRMEDCSGR